MASNDKYNNYDHLDRLNAMYSKFEGRVPLLKNGNEHLKLPHFNGNKNLPIHRWFTYKEGFSADLLEWVCEVCEIDLNETERILDPFVGVGTSLLSAQLTYSGNKKLSLIGIERNPFTAFVANTKLGWESFDHENIKATIPKLVRAIRKGSKERAFSVPELSTLRNESIFSMKDMQSLLFAKEVIKNKLALKQDKEFFELGWAAIIEVVSNVRKDGRALRLVSKDTRPDIPELLETKWNQMLWDIQTLAGKLKVPGRGKSRFRIIEGDGRTLQALGTRVKPFDLILYSPPYLNNLDYTEVYKMELWLSGAIKNYEEFRRLRSKTFRSHPSYKFDDTELVDKLHGNTWARRLRDILIDVLPDDTYYPARERTIRGYMDDMLLSLKNQFRVVKEGGFVVCIVGNSLHGTKEHPIPINTDLLIAALAETVGFTIVKIQATRHTNRRQHVASASRESAIILRRPKIDG